MAVSKKSKVTNGRLRNKPFSQERQTRCAFGSAVIGRLCDRISCRARLSRLLSLIPSRIPLVPLANSHTQTSEHPQLCRARA